jgi:hypothetical protein
VVKLKRECVIRAMDVDSVDGRIFLADFEYGDIYLYKAQVPFSAQSPIELIAVTKGPPKARVIKYWKERNELYIGCADGKMSIIEIANFTKGPICKGDFQSILGHRLHQAACRGHNKDNSYRKGFYDCFCRQRQGNEILVPT